MIRLLLASVLVLLTANSPAADPLKIHLISGSKEYKSEPSLKAFQQHLEKKISVEVSASWVKDGAKDLPDIDKVPKADLLIVCARRMKLPEDQMAIIRKHWDSGKPVVGIRTASHAFGREDNAVFDRKVLGGNYTGQFGGDPVKVESTEDGKSHPVLAGVGAITSLKLYKAGELSKNAIVLQHGSIEGKKDSTNAVTWVNTFKLARHFYTSLGVPEDFKDPDFIRLLENAIFWTTKKAAKDYTK